MKSQSDGIRHTLESSIVRKKRKKGGTFETPMGTKEMPPPKIKLSKFHQSLHKIDNLIESDWKKIYKIEDEIERIKKRRLRPKKRKGPPTPRVKANGMNAILGMVKAPKKRGS